MSRERLTVGDILDYLWGEQYLILYQGGNIQLFTTPDLIRLDDGIRALKIRRMETTPSGGLRIEVEE